MFNKINFFINNILKYLIFFIIFFVWINYYYPNFFNSVLIAITLSSITCFFVNYLYYKKNDKQNLSKKEKNKANNFLIQLMFYDHIELLNIIYNSLNNKDINLKHNGIEIKNTFIVPCFNNIVNENIFLQVYKNFKKSNKNKLLILCNSTSDTLINFIDNFENNLNTQILIGIDCYSKFFKPYNIKIENKVNLKQKSHLQLKQVVNLIFNRKNSKSYSISATILLIFSFIYRFGLYYQIFSTILFIFSLICLFNKSNKNTDINIIE